MSLRQEGNGKYPTKVHLEEFETGNIVLSEAQRKFKPKKPLKPLSPKQQADQAKAEQARSDLHEALDGQAPDG